MPGGPPSGRTSNGKSKPQVVSGYQVAEHHLKSFEVCCQRGQIGKSFSHLSLALCILPQIKEQYYSRYLDIFERWSSTVEENNGFQQAMTIFEVALSRYPESPDIHHLLAKTLYRNGNVHEAWTYSLMAQKACAHDPNTRETRARLTNALVDRWHLPMLNDMCRNKAFKHAIEVAVNRGHNTVLDIGSGTGILSVYAKAIGAKKVYACEADKFMCDILGNVLQANFDTPNIQILAHHSTSLNIPSHIPERVGLVVSETVDAGLFGEHILSTLQHAWQNLLLPPPPVSKPLAESKQLCLPQGCCTSSDSDTNESSPQPLYGKVIPQKAEVFVALVTCDYIARQTKLKSTNLPYFNDKKVYVKLEEPYMSEKLSQVPGGYTLLSKWIPITNIDFNSPDDIKAHLEGDVNKNIDIPCIKSGVPDALVLAFNLYLSDEECISSNPDTGTTLWENAVYPVFNMAQIGVGETVKINFNCQGVINLSVLCGNEDERDHICLNADTIMFLNSEKTISAFHSATHQASGILKKQLKSKSPDPFIICDTTPFPVAGLALHLEHPNCKLYVEEESIQETLRVIGIDAHLCEDLEEEVDVLFMWPVMKEGSLKDGLIKKILLYRLMMAENSYVFPQTLDLVVSAIDSPVLASMTRVDDKNTCGVKVAEVFNIVKTLHHLDVPLDALPHSLVIPDPIPMLRLSLTSAETEARNLVKEERTSGCSDMLVLGGEVVKYTKELVVSNAASLIGIPYWFVMNGSVNSTVSEPHSSSQGINISTRGVDSPCNQSILMLEEPLHVGKNSRIALRVNWRDGIFGASVQCTE